MKEVEVGRAAIEFLEGEGWDCYQEVTSYSGIADIVATRGPLVLVVECKVTFSMAVMQQAWSWRPYAHCVAIATPKHPGRGGIQLVERVLRREKIGALVTGQYRTQWWIEPQIDRAASRKAAKLRAALRPEHKTAAEAGSSRGGHWTPFKATSQRVTAFVRKERRTTIPDVLKHVDHHYQRDSTFRSCLVQLVERGVIAAVRLERDGKRIHLVYDESVRPL